VMKFANIKCIIGAKVICVDQAIGFYFFSYDW